MTIATARVLAPWKTKAVRSLSPITGARARKMSISLKTIAPPGADTRFKVLSITTLSLVALGDFLLFGHALGLNIALLLLAIATAVLLTSRRRWTFETTIYTTVFAAITLLVIEHPGVSSLTLSAMALVILSIERFSGAPDIWSKWPSLLLRFASVAPFRLVRDLVISRRGQRGQAKSVSLFNRVLPWLSPIGLSLVFVLLFRMANPIIDLELSRIDLGGFLSLFSLERVLFWFVCAALLWTILRPRLMRFRKARSKQPDAHSKTPGAIFGPTATIRALILFNLLFAVQSILDATYLWGGVALPDGMSYAAYAHRGAYPLLFTALLAAAFVLGAMRRNGQGADNKLIRMLVYIWVGQNILLCVSAILRLELYVEAYSLTVFRLVAGTWMVLVACGLALIIARIFLHKSSGWLMSTNLVTLSCAMIGFSFVDASALVARYNLAHCAEMGGHGQRLDFTYLSQLGPSIIPALDENLAAQADTKRANFYAIKDLRERLLTQFLARESDWRAGTFRTQRLDAYLNKVGD